MTSLSCMQTSQSSQWTEASSLSFFTRSRTISEVVAYRSKASQALKIWGVRNQFLMVSSELVNDVTSLFDFLVLLISE